MAINKLVIQSADRDIRCIARLSRFGRIVERTTTMIIMPCVIMTMPSGSGKDYMETLYRNHRRLMYAAAWEFTHDPAAADDIVSDACIALMQRMDVIRPLEEKPLLTYIAVTVRNTARNHLKKQRRISKYVIRSDADALNQAADQTDLEKRIVLDEELDAVWEAIQQLPGQEQLVMQMKFDFELSDAEIARQLGLSPSSVSTYISRARRHLKKILYAKQGE